MIAKLVVAIDSSKINPIAFAMVLVTDFFAVFSNVRPLCSRRQYVITLDAIY